MFIIAESNQLYLGDMLFYLVSFLIMAALVWHFAWKPVTQMMQKRADKIANDIDSAAQSREEAQKLAAKRQEELKGSRQEAATIVDNAKQAGESQRAEIIATAQQDAQNLKNQAQRTLNKPGKTPFVVPRKISQTCLLRLLPSSSTSN